MCSQDTQEQMLACLRSMEETLSSDQYEYSGPYTIGGATGIYAQKTPWNTECEWGIISALAVGTLGSTATYALGSQNPAQPTLSSSSSFALTTASTDTMNSLQSYVGALTSQAPFITYAGDDYVALGPPHYIYLSTNTPNSTAVLVTIQFRRKLIRYIPDIPRPKPHTHMVPSRRALRSLPAQSPMVAGFAAQYPQEGVAYQHQDLPQQDTAVARRGIFPLGQTRGIPNGRRG